MLRTPLIEQEILRLKNKDKPKIKENVVPPNLIDGPIDQRNLRDERVFRLASETASEEAELELNSLLQQFREWQRTHKGTFKDFLKSNQDIKIIKISKILADRRKVAKEGGVIDKANRPKEPQVKEINLMGDFHKLMDMLAKMSPQERRSIQWLVDKTFGKK